MSLAIRRLAPGESLERCLAIRETVFIGEQGVPAELERDGLDAACRHYIAMADGRAVGTARVRPLEHAGKPAGKIQRVAVLAPLRGQGIGVALMRAILADLAADPGFGAAVLDSQVSAIGFYEALGFVAEGPEFLDAGIAHRRMRLPLSR